MTQIRDGLRNWLHTGHVKLHSVLERLSDRLPLPLRRAARLPLLQGITLVVATTLILIIAGPSSFTSYVVLLISIYLVSVYGLNITIGFSGILSLGQGASFAFGAYIVAVLAATYAWPIWLTLPLALIGGFLIGALVGLPAGRLAALAIAMVSLGTVLVVSDMLVALDDITMGFSGISGISPLLTFGDGYIDSVWFIPMLIIGSALLAYWFHARYRTSRIGRATAAVRDEAIGATALGIGGYGVKVAAFAIGSGMGGFAGGLFAYLSGYISPDAFTPALSILFLVMVVLGGLGSQLGPLVGVVILVTIPLALAPYPHVNVIVYGLILILLMLLRPRGLFSRTAASADPVATTLSQLARSEGSPGQQSPTSSDDVVLAVQDIKRSFGGLKALDGVSLELRAGEILGLIGPNGSGKTTLLNIISGYYHPTAGSVVLNGSDISSARPPEVSRRGVSRTFQTPKTFDGMSIDEHIEIASKRLVNTDPVRVEACRAAALQLLKFGGLDPDDLKVGRRESRYLAHGQLRFLETAMAVSRCPSVILLDEPAAGLSASEIEGLENVLRELTKTGISVVIVEHHLELVSRLVDRIAVLDLGKLLWEGNPADLHDVEAVRVAYMGTV